MKKITKILAILVSMTLVLNLQVFSIFGEEIQPDPVIETDMTADIEAGSDAEADKSIIPEAESESMVKRRTIPSERILMRLKCREYLIMTKHLR